MRRFNYAPRPHELALATAADIALAPRRHATIAIVGALLATLTATAGVELLRLANLDRSVGVMNERAAQDAATATRLAAGEAELARLRRVAAAISSARRAALVGLNDVALLGNRLPTQTWLTRIHADRNGTWEIEGRAGIVPEVGTTLAGLKAIDPTADVRLLSLAGPGERLHSVRFSLAWERGRP